jgi:hypothetical protein
MPHKFFQYLFDLMVHAIAVVVAAVLTDPAVKEAIANVIVTGVTNFVRQPNLDEHLLFANQTIGRTRDTMASKAGQDFPKVVGAFVKGMFQMAPAAPVSNEKSDDKDKLEEGSSSDKEKAQPALLDNEKRNSTNSTKESKSNLVKPEEDDHTATSSEEGDDIFQLPSIPIVSA